MDSLFINDFVKGSNYKNLKKAIYEKKSPILITGLTKIQATHVSYMLNQNMKSKIIYIVSNINEAKDLLERCQGFDMNAVIINVNEIRFYSVDASDRKEEAALLKGLHDVYLNNYDVAIITIESLLSRVVPKELLLKSILDIDINNEIIIDEFVKKLLDIGYSHEHKVEGIGQFSRRGGIIDVFSPNYDNPIRLEFFGDEIDSIRFFDIYSQKSIEKTKQIQIIPSKKFIYPDNTESAINNINKEIKKNTSEDILSDLEKMRNKMYFSGVEKYANYFFKEAESSIWSYFDEDAIVLVDEPNRVFEKARNYDIEFKENFVKALEKGFAINSQCRLISELDSVREQLGERTCIFNSYLPKHISDFKVKAILSYDCKSAPKFLGKMNIFIDEIIYLRKKKFKIVIADSKINILKNIEKILEENNIYASFDIKNDVCLIEAKISEGFIYNDEKVAVFTGSDIFRHTKEEKKKKNKEHKSKKIESFIELNKGDYVVHETYGIGHFIALEQKEFDGITKDYIKVQYGGGDTLYLPLEQMDRIQKYIGSKNEQQIKLSKLGTSEWKKAKARAKKQVEEVAKEIVELYAKREVVKGYQFSNDTMWQHEFEQEFPFEETGDQLRAINDIKNDMQSSKVMDRLICGDVGYGKTEVAIRAIFKACMDSKQAAVLCPTTILAQQHYENLKERFENYPIKIEVLSRFKSKKEHEEIIKRVNQGLVDVVVGTHSILTKEISFKDLGLLVIDEEQRFGVKHKEKLKELRTNIDVITLSATPIPRTLHLSLSGIRDMSLLEEPPHDRHPILTYLTEAKEGIIVDAVEREVARGGQVYFVYNRVETMEKLYNTLKRLLPNIEIAMAHGQMSSRRLENVMMDFHDKKYDVLLATTIIETGLDISNANTIIIYDADKMGLSQLYQLRGRVGRATRQAYAYLMYEKNKVLTEIAEQRLKTIKEFTEFGSGFKIAMRDLEIRGAGSVLGESQSGHMAEIGYELYIKYLDIAVKVLKGEAIDDSFEPEIGLKLNAYIPSEYIEDEIDKIEIYKKIASIRGKDDMLEVDEEIEDRFSDIPTEVRVLMNLAYIKSLCKMLKIASIKENNGVLAFYDRNNKIIVKKAFGKLDDYKLVVTISSFLEKLV